jgi:hypothetical protein
MSGWNGPALFRRLPKLCYHLASSPIAMLTDCDEFPDLRDDLHFLAEVLQPQFEKCDIEALREQNRYRRQQLVLLAGGTIGAILGALQAAFDKVTWLGWLVVAITLVFGVLHEDHRTPSRPPALCRAAHPGRATPQPLFPVRHPRRSLYR